jgi:hypothetical protein
MQCFDVTPSFLDDNDDLATLKSARRDGLYARHSIDLENAPRKMLNVQQSNSPESSSPETGMSGR